MDYSDFFGESSNWNDFAGLWIDNNDYLVCTTDLYNFIWNLGFNFYRFFDIEILEMGFGSLFPVIEFSGHSDAEYF